MTYRALYAVKKKYRLYAKYKNRKHPAYVRAAASAKKSINSAKLNFEHKLADNIRTDKKSFFAYARNAQRSKPAIGPLINQGGDLVSDVGDVVEVLNEHYATVFTVDDPNNATQPELVFNTEEAAPLNDLTVDSETISKILHKLVTGKTAGNDHISTSFLKPMSDVIAQPISLLLRKSLDEGSVPLDWRTANITPIYIKGSRKEPANYRPISLTSHISKVMESVVRDAMMEHLNKHQLLRNSQHGFRSKRSCVTNLIEFLDVVMDYLDNKDGVDVIFLDFAKAFDKVSHVLLLKKLSSHGIGGKVYSWIKAWLTDRVQRVCVAGAKSSWRRVTSGVPQGSVLGPILFLIYINDIDTRIVNHLLKFADDTKLFGTASNQENIRSLQEDLDLLAKWSNKWRMPFNQDKCTVMHLGQCNVGQQYHLGMLPLATTERETDLGIIHTVDLKAAAQCTLACQKANRILGMLARTIPSRDHRLMTKLYKSLVRPHLEYGVVAWSPRYQKDKDLLERVQHRFTRLFPDLRSKGYIERLQKLQLWSLEERRNRADLIEVFKMYRGLTDVPFDQFFQLSKSITRGHIAKIVKKQANTTLKLHFFSLRVVNCWNRLPVAAVEAKTIEGFKTQMAKLRSNQMGYFLD